MIEKGDLDIANNMSRYPISTPCAKTRSLPSTRYNAAPCTTNVAMSMKEAHFANPKVREAVRYLTIIRINKALMPGYGVLHQRPIKAGDAVNAAGSATALISRRRKSCWRKRATRTVLIPPCACSDQSVPQYRHCRSVDLRWQDQRQSITSTGNQTIRRDART